MAVPVRNENKKSCEAVARIDSTRFIFGGATPRDRDRETGVYKKGGPKKSCQTIMRTVSHNGFFRYFSVTYIRLWHTNAVYFKGIISPVAVEILASGQMEINKRIKED